MATLKPTRETSKNKKAPHPTPHHTTVHRMLFNPTPPIPNPTLKNTPRQRKKHAGRLLRLLLLRLLLLWFAHHSSAR